MTTRRIARVLFLCALSAGFAQAQVTIAERPLLGGFTTIQAGIAAAFEGESLLVMPGTYAPFTIDGKSVSVFVTGTGEATIVGNVNVKNLAPAQSVILSRLNLTGQIGPNFDAALGIANVLGHARIEDSTIKGYSVTGSGGPASPLTGTAARVTASLNVVFSGCTLEAGRGFSDAGPIEGGPGLDSVNSSIAAYGCTIEGGYGSYETVPRGGNGGPGFRGLRYGLFASGCTFEGGLGGSGDPTSPNPVGGTGGDALVIDAGQAHLLDDSFVAGAGGWPNFPSGQTIVALNGSIIDQMPGTRRSISAPRITPDDASVPITITGQPGDVVYLMLGRNPSFLWKPQFRGCLLVPVPLFSSGVATGTIGANGTLVIQRTFSIVDGTVAARKSWLQALIVDSSGQVRLSGPAHVLSIDAVGLPDCNGNARQDVVDVLFGGVADCNANLVPDSCDLAAGALDCNANGIPDSCDIASHFSLDDNHNGIPDECDPHQTWYVDDSAVPGGNGSQAAPFQLLQTAVTASASGDTIMLMDGLYQGASNRDIVLNNRSLTLRSANGPGNCTIDCQSVTRALTIFSSVNNAVRVNIEGITFVNGRIVDPVYFVRGGAIDNEFADLTVRNCVFASCFAQHFGGAIGSKFGSLRIEGCVFTGNSSINGPYGYGGALSVETTTLSVRDCTFSNNLAGSGGAFWFQQPYQAIVTHCTFLENHANSDGGAGWAYGSAPAVIVTFDDCLFAGNSAARNGGALATETSLNISNSSFVSNTAGVAGGAIHCTFTGTALFKNSLAWGNNAPSGSALFMQAPPGPAGSLSVSYCDMQGGQAGVSGSVATLVWGAGNLDLDPRFADPDGPDNNLLTYGDNDYALRANSPCIDAGDNGAIIPDLLDVDGDGNTSEAMPLDLRHQPRRKDVISVPDTGAGAAPIVDMGALERQG